MKKSLLFIAITLLNLGFVASVCTRTCDAGSAKSFVHRERDIKPGMMAAHNKHSAGFVNIFRTLDTPNRRIAMVPIAGNENEVLYITGSESFAQLETILNTTDKKMEGVSGSVKTELDWLNKEAPALHAGMRDMLTVFRPELSYNPGVDIRMMRYFSITTLRVPARS
jgi:hypothetical protein